MLCSKLHCNLVPFSCHFLSYKFCDQVEGSERHPKLMGRYAKTDLRHHARNVYSLAVLTPS